MNRYTYKAKRKDKPTEWVYGYYVTIPKPSIGIEYNGERHFICECQDTMMIKPIEIDFKTLCQCTELPDIEDNYIFENDIVTVVGRKYIIEFRSGMFGIMINNNTKFWSLCEWIIENKKAGNNYKIIGNKFDDYVVKE